MKKTLKILLCLMLAVGLAFSFSACTNSEKDNSTSQSDAQDKKDKKEKNPQKLAEQTAKNFMDALCKLDMQTMSKYVTVSDDVKNVFPFQDVRSYIKDAVYSQIGNEGTNLKEVINPVLDKYIEIFMSSISYEIADCKKTEDGYVFEAKMHMMDADAATKTIEDAFSQANMSAVGEDVAIELAENGIITAESTQEETIQALLDGVAKKMVPKLENALKQVGTTEDTVEIPVIKQKDKWLVDTKDGDTFKNMKIVKFISK